MTHRSWRVDPFRGSRLKLQIQKINCFRLTEDSVSVFFARKKVAEDAMAALKLLVVAALVVSAASLTVKRDAASSQRQKKSCSYPGCGTAEEPISKEDQNAAMMDKQQRAADTAMQTAGRPGVAPFTVNTAPFPAAVYGKDKQKKMAGKHTDMVHHAKEALKTLFVQVRYDEHPALRWRR